MLCQPHTPTPTLAPLRSCLRVFALLAALAALALVPAVSHAAEGSSKAAAGSPAAQEAQADTAPSASREAGSDKDSTKESGSEKSYEDQPVPAGIFDEEAAKEAPAKKKDPASGGTIGRMILGLLFVLAVIYGVYWLLKHYSKSRFAGMSAGNAGAIEVMATTPLAANRALHLVRVGDEVVLIGATESSISQLGRVDSGRLRDIAGESGDGQFQQVLHGAMARPTGSTTSGPYTGDGYGGGVTTEASDTFVRRFIANLQMMTTR